MAVFAPFFKHNRHFTQKISAAAAWGFLTGDPRLYSID
jgi:hypothetical protein